MTIKEEILKNSGLLTETVAVEFYNFDDSIFAIVNGKRYSLKEFLASAKKDSGFAEVLMAIQKKMKTLDFNGNIIEFIKKFFGHKNEKLDVIVKNGVANMYGRSNGKLVQFDNDEINSTLGGGTVINHNKTFKKRGE